MVVIVLSGGIGAQMFQFAAGYSLAKKNNCKLAIDACWFKKDNQYATKPFTINKILNLNSFFIIKNIWISRLLRFYFLIIQILSFGKYRYIRLNLQNPLKYKKIPSFKNLFFNGYVQNVDYFKNDIKEILDKLKLNNQQKQEASNIVKIALHVRKGDQKDGPVDCLDNDYYQNAIKKIIDKKNLKFDDVHVSIFCEELEWPKNYLNFDYRIKNIDYIIGDDESAIEDLRKMTTYDHLIIPNSGYGWWAGAYISVIKNGLVVCPDVWWNKISANQTNIYLNDWLVINTKIEKNENPEFTK